MKHNRQKTLSDRKNPNFNQTTLDTDIFGNFDNPETRNQLKNMIFKETLNESKKKIFIGKAFRGEIPPKFSLSNEDLFGWHWEYVIVLPNPDFPGIPNHPILPEEVSNFYKHCFKSKKTGNIQKDTLNYLQEVNAFIRAYNTLKPLSTGKCLKDGKKFIISEGQVTDTNIPAADFMTLVRNVIYYKLVSSLGLKVKQLVSKTGEYIFFLITSDESTLQLQAERARFNKQLEISLTDLQSLLPCDSSLRPFHILKTSDEEIKNLFKDIKPFLSKALNLQKNSEKIDYKQDPDQVSVSMWRTYKIYLTLLKDGILKITSSVNSFRAQMFLFKKIIKNSIEKANFRVADKDKLKNLWDRIEVFKPIPPYSQFRRGYGNEEIGNRWRTHEIDECGRRSLFRNMERLRLIGICIETEIGLSFLQERGFIIAHFPLHNVWQLKGKNMSVTGEFKSEDRVLREVLYDVKSEKNNGPLIKCWNTALIGQKIPLSKIRNYYGEKIALYFEFLRYFQCNLVIPALIGISTFIIQCLYDQHSLQVLSLNIFYSTFMIIWATIYLENWRRKESSLSILWGTTKYEQIEVPRPQYKGVKRRSPITDEMEEIYYPASKRVKFMIFGITITLLILCLVLGIVSGLILLKWQITDKLVINGFNLAGPLCSVLNAIQIVIFNGLYGKLAKFLTDLENHKTENQYQDSLIIKIFTFQFINSFNSLFYIAFIKKYTEECMETDSQGKAYKSPNCMNELFIQLISIFIVSYIKNLIEIGRPYLKFQLRKIKKSKNKIADSAPVKDLRDKVESQLYLEYFLTTDTDGTIDEYMELAIQFGYLTLFALAFPLSTSLAFIGLWIEMHTDKIKLIHLVRRPVPLSAKNIGTWFHIFSIISVFAIFTNTALFCFTSNTFDFIERVKGHNYAIFAAVVIILLALRNQIQRWIPDVGENYGIVKARHDFIVEKAVRDDDETVGFMREEEFDTNLYFANFGVKDKEMEFD